MQRERANQATFMRYLFKSGVPFGLMGDGSNDRTLIEQEAVVLRFIDADGKPFNTIYDLAPLDLSKSVDGRSPDAQCISLAYAQSMSDLNNHPSFVNGSDWKKAIVGASFDGASVMLGAQNGVAARLTEMAETHVAVIHAVAHVQQLGDNDAFNEVDYYSDWRAIVQEVYLYYSQSGKKRFGLENAADQLGEKLLKLTGTHGIRWAASQALSVKVLVTDLPAVVADLEYVVKKDAGCHFTMLTPSNSFLRKSFMHEFEGENGHISRWKATVQSFVPSPDGISARDTFTTIYKNKETLQLSKAELVSRLTVADEQNAHIVNDERWKLRGKLIDWRFNAFSAFMLDVHEQLAILSKSYQSNSLVLFDISRNINKTLRALRTLKQVPGPHESELLAACAAEGGADCLRTCQLFDGEEGRKLFKLDREYVLDALTTHLSSRFQKVLDDPILQVWVSPQTWHSNSHLSVSVASIASLYPRAMVTGYGCL